MTVACLAVLVSRRAIVVVRMRVVRGAVVVVSEGHTHARRDGRHTLHRDADGKDRDGYQTEQGAKHRLELYVRCFDFPSIAWFPLSKAFYWRLKAPGRMLDVIRPATRRLVLTAHVTCSVGWFGAVACFLALAIAGMTTPDAATARATYVAMAIVGWLVVVPLSFGSLASGIVQAFATPWGLLRHYWIVVKGSIAVLATVLLLAHMQPTSTLAHAALQDGLADPGITSLRVRLAANAAAACFVLLVAVALGVFKPKGRIGEDVPRWLKLMIAPAIVLVAGFGMLHRLV